MNGILTYCSACILLFSTPLLRFNHINTWFSSAFILAAVWNFIVRIHIFSQCFLLVQIFPHWIFLCFLIHFLNLGGQLLLGHRICIFSTTSLDFAKFFLMWYIDLDFYWIVKNSFAVTLPILKKCFYLIKLMDVKWYFNVDIIFIINEV